MKVRYLTQTIRNARVQALSAISAMVFTLGLILPSGATPAMAQTDKLVLALTPPSGQSTRFWSTPPSWLFDPSLESLVEQDPVTGEYTGNGLATSWEHNKDFTEWTFKLRKGVQFHYGFGEFTAADVVHSYALHTGPDSTVPGVAQLRGGKAEALDRYTVRFTYDKPRVRLLFMHAARALMKIYSKAQFDKEGLKGYDRRFAGTGHFRFVSLEPTAIRYERVDNHYSGIVPDFREMEMRFVAENATKLAMLLAGEAHITELPRELVVDALKAGMKTAQSAKPTMQTDIVFNGLYCESKDPNCRRDLPWFDVRIREAINRSLNRQEMLEVLFPGGGASLAARHSMVRGNEGYDPMLVERFEAEYGYDLEKAKQLMWHAGYPDSFKDPTITLIMTAIPGQPEIPLQMEMVHQYLTKVGFKVKFKEVDHAGVGALGRARKLYALNPLRNAPPRPTEIAFRAFYSNPGGPYQGWEDDWTSARIKEMVNSVDMKERDQIARRLFNYLYEQYVDIPLFEVFTQIPYNPKVVSGWQFPGATTSGYSHFHLIKAAK